MEPQERVTRNINIKCTPELFDRIQAAIALENKRRPANTHKVTVSSWVRACVEKILASEYKNI